MIRHGKQNDAMIKMSVPGHGNLGRQVSGIISTFNLLVSFVSNPAEQLRQKKQTFTCCSFFLNFILQHYSNSRKIHEFMGQMVFLNKKASGNPSLVLLESITCSKTACYIHFDRLLSFILSKLIRRGKFPC